MIINIASYIKQILFISDLNKIDNKNIIRDFIIKDEDEITINEVEKLFKYFLVTYLYLVPLKPISSLYESITSKKYLLGYCGISFSFNHNCSIYREYFMKVSSCYLETEFFLHMR